MIERRRFLLDTNVVSETRKIRPNQSVLRFMERTRPTPENVFVSALTVGELRRGAEKPRAVDIRYSDDLHAWIDAFELDFEDRILPVDVQVARIWGTITIGRSRPLVDTLIAATAIAHDLVLVTRNVVDMREVEVEIVNPWHEV